MSGPHYTHHVLATGGEISNLDLSSLGARAEIIGVSCNQLNSAARSTKLQLLDGSGGDVILEVGFDRAADVQLREPLPIRASPSSLFLTTEGHDGIAATVQASLIYRVRR